MIHPTLPYLHRVKPWEYRYRDALGMAWTITCECPAVPWRGEDWHATDENYEPGNRIAYGATLEEAIADIEECVAEAAL